MSSVSKKRLRGSIEDCPLGGGAGSIEVSTAGIIRIEMCKCAVRVLAQERIVQADIPRRLYDWDLRNLSKKFRVKNFESLNLVKKYVNNLEKNIRLGRGLWVSSPPGLGKNHLLCYILRLALEKEYNAHFIKAQKVIEIKLEAWKDRYSPNLLSKIIDYSDIVALADIEKGPLSPIPDNFKVQSFYEFLCDIDDGKISLLISSNIPKLEVLKRVPPFMQARLRNIKEAVLLYPSTWGEKFHG